MSSLKGLGRLPWYIKEGKISPDEHCCLTICENFSYDFAITDEMNASRRLLCRKDEFNSWVDSLYPDVDVYQASPEFRKIILMQVLSCCLKHWDAIGFIPEDLIDLTANTASAVVQRLSVGGLHFSMALDGWSEEDIEISTQGWLDSNRYNNDIDISLPVIIGYTVVNLKKTLELKAGDGIVLRTIADETENSFFLIFGNKKVTMTRVDDTYMKMERISEMADIPGMTECVFEDLPVTVAAEIGHVQFRLAQLLALQPGDVIEGNINTPGVVKLLVNGNCVGFGNLLSLNEKLVVKVKTIYRRHSSETISSITE
ncbi:hypothetical protein CF635_003531 [Enterobacter hormaechei]|nr:hypothetical protein [Enterobacter hormaechei]